MAVGMETSETKAIASQSKKAYLRKPTLRFVGTRLFFSEWHFLIPLNLLFACGSFGKTIGGSIRSVGAFFNCVFFFASSFFFLFSLKGYIFYLLLVLGFEWARVGSSLYLTLVFLHMSCIFFLLFLECSLWRVGTGTLLGTMMYLCAMVRGIARHMMLAFDCYIASVFCDVIIYRVHQSCCSWAGSPAIRTSTTSPPSLTQFVT